jgi:hypothetical protein
VLDIVLREINAIGAGWCANWIMFDGRPFRNQLYDLVKFDGRTLRTQLNDLADWASTALQSDHDLDYTEGTEFMNDQKGR